MTAWSKAELAGHVAGMGPADTVLHLRTVRCACGTEIVADAANPAPQVLRHNQTRVHVLWWLRQEADYRARLAREASIGVRRPALHQQGDE